MRDKNLAKKRAVLVRRSQFRLFKFQIKSVSNKKGRVIKKSSTS